MHYDVVILETSSVALGLAAALQQRCRVLLLSRTALVAAEFINAFKPGENWPEQAGSPPAANVLAAMQEENLFFDGACRLYSAGSVFYQAFSRLTAEVRFETDLLDIRQTDDGYAIKIVNRSGISRLTASQVIDTGDAGLQQRNKTLRAILVGDDASAEVPRDYTNIRFIREADPKPPTLLMCLTCAAEQNLYAARHRLIETWRQMAGHNPPWKMAAIAQVFALSAAGEPVGLQSVCNQRTGWPPGLTYLSFPASGFANPIAAIDAGYQQGEVLTV